MFHRSIVAILAFVCVPLTCPADTWLKQRQHTDAYTVMGQEQPATDMVQTVWLGSDRMKSDDGRQSAIIRLDRQKIYFIDHAGRTYTEMPMDMDLLMDEATRGEDMTAEEMQQFKEMARGMMKMTFSVKETGKTKKIGKWRCSGYVQTVQTMMGNITSEIWATRDIKIDYDRYATFSAATMAMQPGMQQSLEQTMAELKKIRGVPVFSSTTTQMMGATMTTSQELLDIREKNPPKGCYDLPAGYTRIRM